MKDDPLTLDWQKAAGGLLPAVVQHARTAEVLMLGYMNEEAWRRTCETRYVTFYSRSRQRLWKKGETSGHTLRLVSAAADCDGDAILVRAVPAGPTCHTGRRSCFAAEELGTETLGRLIETIGERAENAAGSSYTRRLLAGGIDAYGAKVLEEADEVVRAARHEGKERTIEEAADVLYHLFVLLRGEGIELDDVAAALRRRRRPAAGA